MLVLFESPSGFALIKVLNEGKLSKAEDLWKEFNTAETVRQVVKVKAFSKFEDTIEALSAAMLLTDSKPSKGLCKFLHAIVMVKKELWRILNLEMQSRRNCKLNVSTAQGLWSSCRE